jgi:cephalosporin-C deacetylase
LFKTHLILSLFAVLSVFSDWYLLFSPPAMVLAIETEVDFGKSEGNFKQGELMTITYKLKNNSPKAIQGTIAGSISLLGEKVVHRFQQFVELKPQQSSQVSFKYSPTEAGVYFVYLRLRNNFGNLAENSVLTGYALDKIDSPITRKDDFDGFWQNTIQQLNAIKPNFRLSKKADLSTADYQVYALEMQSWGNQTIRGWYRVPTQYKGKLPVVLQLPSLGGGFYNVKSLLEKPKHGIPYDFAVLSLNIREHGNSKTDEDIKDYNQLISKGLETKESYFYRGAVMDCIRALDFLATRSELDPEKLVIEGASQGGALALIVSSLDARVRLCAPDVPFLSDVDKLHKSAKWVGDELARYAKLHKGLTSWRLLQNLTYFDTKNFADKIRVPVLMSVGLQDWTCPASTCWATYNKITAPKDCWVYPEGRHEGGGARHRVLKFEWIRAQLKD